MRAWVLALAGIAALIGGPAEAKDRHPGYSRPAVTLSYGYGYPYGWYGGYRPWGYYYPSYFGSYYGPSYYGVGVRVGRPYRVRRERAEPAEQAALKLYVYPAAGQSERQLADDRYECHVWAADRSGHDPTLGAGSRREADEYTRAFTACMEGRSYVVK